MLWGQRVFGFSLFRDDGVGGGYGGLGCCGGEGGGDVLEV